MFTKRENILYFILYISNIYIYVKIYVDMFFNSSKILKKWWHQESLNLKIVILVCSDQFEVISYHDSWCKKWVLILKILIKKAKQNLEKFWKNEKTCPYVYLYFLEYCLQMNYYMLLLLFFLCCLRNLPSMSFNSPCEIFSPIMAQICPRLTFLIFFLFLFIHYFCFLKFLTGGPMS